MGIARTHGTAAEDLAAAYLALLGWEVEARNTRLGGVEVDLVARDGRTTVLIEVKYRSRADYGGADAAIDGRKRERLRRAARVAAAGRPDVRIDVVSVEPSPDGLALTHYRNAVTAGP
jgi:putative endonuclease